MKKSKFWKNEKKPGDIITLYLCITNDDHITYGSWDMECDWQNFFVSLGHFLPFYPTNNPENENLEKSIKHAWRYYPFTHVYHKLRSYDTGSWDIRCNGQSFLSFWAIFCPLTLLTTQKIKILKQWKKLLQILSL